MDDLAAELDDTLERCGQVGDAEVRKRDAVARAGAALVDSELRPARVRLDAAALALAPALELRAQQSLPEPPRPFEVIRRELDQVNHERRLRLVSSSRTSSLTEAASAASCALFFRQCEQEILNLGRLRVVGRPGENILDPHLPGGEFFFNAARRLRISFACRKARSR